MHKRKYKRHKRHFKQKIILFACLVMTVLILVFFVSNLQGNRDFSSGTSTDIADNTEWYLTLVNHQNHLPDDYKVDLTMLKNGSSVDSRIYPDLQDMFDHARAEGLYPEVTSGYRTFKQQQNLLDEEIEAYKVNGYSDSEAEELAKQWVAVPGTSEHELGLAVDINLADSGSSNQEVYDWLDANAYQYGFILRYPANKTDITGISYEPWHYRYVGKEAAEEIYNQGLCLEEYLNDR